ncbi:Tn3 family transposase [Klebsiella pneumoniae]|uniref:Tn3 family transposase n=1 Tax=Klebsiella pneumoniae TaxID=573 RepID=UPI00388F974D
MAEACNIGLEPLIRSNVPALTRHRLNWTKANYLRAELSPALMPDWLIFRQTPPLAQIWGGGEVAFRRWNALCYASQNNQCRTEPQILW